LYAASGGELNPKRFKKLNTIMLQGKIAMFKKTVFPIIACIACLLFALPAIAGEGNGRTFLIHAKTSMKLDDAQICVVPNVALAALAKGTR